MELLNKLFDSLHEIVCVLDIDGRFVYVNKASYTIWGYHPEELIGKYCYDLMVKEDKALSLAATNEVYQGADIPSYENRYYRKDGSVVEMLWEGGWDVGDQLMYSTGRDISERKRIEREQLKNRQELQLAKQQLEELLDRITDGFIGLDDRAAVTYWNRAAEAISKISPQAIIGKVLWDVIPEPGKSKYLAFYRMAKEANKPMTVEFFSDRMQTWVEANTYTSGTGLSIFFRDISERKAFQEKLNQEKQKQQKRITAAVIKATEQERAHVGKELHDNVNQVLTTVKLYTELCLSQECNREQLLKKSSGLLQGCIDEIRGISQRLSPPSFGTSQLKESVEELVATINATKQLQVHFESRLNGLQVTQEIHLAIYRILQEHLTNILKHANAQHVEISLTVSEDILTLIVRDDGKGFDMQQRRSGIGITNMETRADNLNGSFSLDSIPGAGTTLLVCLPLREETD